MSTSSDPRARVQLAMLATMRARQHRTITTLGTLGMSAGLIAAVTGIPVATVARIIGGTR